MYDVKQSEYFEKQLEKLKDKGTINRILKGIKQLELDPVNCGEDLLYQLKGYKSLRIGDWRVAYQVQEQTVHVVAMGHGHGVYHEMKRYLRATERP
jgi:addiction module RelE/StbE family toxin